MKLTAVAKANKKAASILGILLLMVLSSGCMAQITQVEQKTGNPRKCREAEVAVKKAQEQSDNAIGELAQKKSQNTVKSTATNLKTLQELEEKAFEMCDPTNQQEWISSSSN